MKRHSIWASARHPSRAAILLASLLLVGCAAGQAFREGNKLLQQGDYENGIAKLEEAVKLDPSDAEFRITLVGKRATIIAQLNKTAEIALLENRLPEAERLYSRVLTIDAENAMAKQGMQEIMHSIRRSQTVAEAESLFKNGTPEDLSAALEKLRPVLAENPNQQDALNLKARINATHRQQQPEAKLADTFRKPISLEFRDAPLKSVLGIVSEVSGINFFYDKDVPSDLRVTVFAKKTTTEDALRLILATNKLEQKILNGNSILIYPSTPEKLKDYQTLSIRTFFLTNGDVKAITNSLKAIVRARDLVYDERLGIIIMRDTPEAIRMAERIVALQDISDPEVVLDVEILEVKRSRLYNLGIEWPSSLALAPLALTSLTSGATSGTTTTTASSSVTTLNDLLHLKPSSTQATLGNTTINATKQDQDSNILANPRIRVRNKEKAKIQIGDRVPVITATTSSGVVTESVNYLDVGLKLEVEPTIYLDDQVGIKVNLEVSSISKEITSNSGTRSYQIGTRGANTVLRLKDGETQVLAGLISDEDRTTSNKIPYLGELPISSRLFGNQKDDSTRSEILLSITPRIVRTIRPPDISATEFHSGTEGSMGSQSLRLSTVIASPDEPAAPPAPTTP